MQTEFSLFHPGQGTKNGTINRFLQLFLFISYLKRTLPETIRLDFSYVLCHKNIIARTSTTATNIPIMLILLKVYIVDAFMEELVSPDLPIFKYNKYGANIRLYMDMVCAVANIGEGGNRSYRRPCQNRTAALALR